jgi:dCTP deaminase
MFLSADAIREKVQGDNDLSIEPFARELLKPASYVMRLGNQTRRWAMGNDDGPPPPVVIWGESETDEQPEDVQSNVPMITVSPGEVVLVTTKERISTPSDLVGFISTLSHLARYGLSAHCNSFLVSPGFGLGSPTPLTLELSSVNPRPLILRPGMPICHLSFARVEDPTHDLEGALGRSVYQGDTGPSGPKLETEFRPILDQIEHR